MKTLLVTGGTGFLGKRVIEYYKEKCEVFAPGHKEMDITDTESVVSLFERVMPDAVIHCAAVSDVGACTEDPEYSFLVNVEGSVHIVEAAKKTGAKCILCSSDQVYVGSKEPKAHCEEEELHPANEYGRQKLLAEKRCLEVNPDCVMLRLSWMYEGNPGCETKPSDFMRNLVKAVERGEKLSYPVYDRRGITDVNEVVRNLEKTFTVPGGVYNFGAPNEENTYDMMCKVFDTFGWNKEQITKNDKAFSDNPRNLSMDQKKISMNGITFFSTREKIEKILNSEK